MISPKEQRIKKIFNLYYSRQDVLKEIFKFSKKREIAPSFMMKHFGKRPDSFQYVGDIFELVKKGATSFHCSEELWENPLDLTTGMNQEQLNDLRIGWDLLIDIDCKWIDYSKKAAEAIINVFKNHEIENIGIKFSGSKGFHIILPWKSFPKEIGGEQTKNLFPELPRKLLAYIGFRANSEIQKLLTEEEIKQLTKKTNIKKGIKCNNCQNVAEEYTLEEHLCSKCHRKELRRVIPGDKKKYKCPDCGIPFDIKSSRKIYECKKCNISSKENPSNFSKTLEIDFFELMGLDLVMVAPRHLFRMPYSLHEKTALASVVLDKNKINEFDMMRDANPMKVEVKDFLPKSKEGESKFLITEALDWAKNNQINAGVSENKIQGKYADFKPIQLKNIQESQFPPCVINILKGIEDGKKRALFILINLFRSIGMDKEELEKRIFEWNKKNKPSLNEGYIKSQLSWSYKKKPIMPPNCKEFYQGIGVCQPDMFCSKVKNPVNYTIKKNLFSNKKSKR